MSKVIWLQTATIFWLGRGIISLSYRVYMEQNEIHTAQPLVPEPSAFVVEMAIEKLKRN